MAGTYIEYDSKKFELQELTIEKWQNIMKFKDIYDEVDMYIMMISEMTGLTPEQIRNGDAKSIVESGKGLYSYINQQSKEVYYQMKYKDVEYELCDFSNMTFGQFIDIDTFVMKDESYKIANLNELAAYLYTEKGKKYGETNFKKNIENFKQLPVKYIEGAVFFLWTLEKGLFGLSEVYSKNKLLWKMIKVRIIFRNFGDTTFGFLNSRKTKFGKLIVLLLSPLFFVSTICRILLTYIRNKIKR
jgi:hypothetical protein